MPEHFHFMVLPQVGIEDEPVPVSRVLHDLKGCAGRYCVEALREVWRHNQTLGTSPLDAWATKRGEHRFWKPRGYDFNITQDAKVMEKIDYIHANPTRRGLVPRAEDWLHSSYRFYHNGDASLMRMDWDGGLPILR